MPSIIPPASDGGSSTTPVPLSAERLAEYAALEQAATEGPWEADAWEINSPGGCWVGETCDVDDDKKSRADAAFIAAARTAVPELLAEVERLNAELAEAQRRDVTSPLAVIAKHGDMSESVRREIRSLLADAEGGAL